MATRASTAAIGPAEDPPQPAFEHTTISIRFPFCNAVLEPEADRNRSRLDAVKKLESRSAPALEAVTKPPAWVGISETDAVLLRPLRNENLTATPEPEALIVHLIFHFISS
jgi:hypothetical protein